MDYILEYRAFFWGNFYLSSIQQGIQALHVVGRMSQSCGQHTDFVQWVNDHETVQLYNGGDSNDIMDMVLWFQKEASNYAWDFFSESPRALNGAVTSVGIILPNHFYTPEYEPQYYDKSFEAELYRKIKKSKFAS